VLASDVDAAGEVEGRAVEGAGEVCDRRGSGGGVGNSEGAVGDGGRERCASCVGWRVGWWGSRLWSEDCSQECQPVQCCSCYRMLLGCWDAITPDGRRLRRAENGRVAATALLWIHVRITGNC